MKKLFRYFLQGLLFVAPAGLTLFFIYWAFETMDRPIRNFIFSMYNIRLPGIGLVAALTFIAIVGWAGQLFIFQPIVRFINNIFEKAPIIKLVYTSLNDFTSAFVGQRKKFTHPVLVKVNLVSELEKVGFITADDLTDLGIKDKVAVLFPHSYNWSGEMFIVPRELITPLNLPPGEVMKFALTGGVARM